MNSFQPVSETTSGTLISSLSPHSAQPGTGAASPRTVPDAFIYTEVHGGPVYVASPKLRSTTASHLPGLSETMVLPHALKSWFEVVIGEAADIRLQDSHSVLEQVLEFAHLKPGWDGQNARAVPSDAIVHTLIFLRYLRQRRLNPPEAFPTGRESVQLEYETPSGEYLEFEIFADRIEMLWMNASNEVLHEDVTTTEEAVEAVERLLS